MEVKWKPIIYMKFVQTFSVVAVARQSEITDKHCRLYGTVA